MIQKTLEEFKTEYVTKEKIEEMVKMGATQEQAEQHYNQSAEFIYTLCNVQPMNKIDVRIRYNSNHKGWTLEQLAQENPQGPVDAL